MPIQELITGPVNSEYGGKPGIEHGRLSIEDLDDLLSKTRQAVKNQTVPFIDETASIPHEMYDDETLKILQNVVFAVHGGRPKRLFAIAPEELASAIVVTISEGLPITQLDENRIVITAGRFCDEYSGSGVSAISIDREYRDSYVQDTLFYYEQLVTGLPSDMRKLFGFETK